MKYGNGIFALHAFCMIAFLYLTDNLILIAIVMMVNIAMKLLVQISGINLLTPVLVMVFC